MRRMGRTKKGNGMEMVGNGIVGEYLSGGQEVYYTCK